MASGIDAVKPRVGISARLRAYFLAGILVTAPFAVTIYLAWSVIRFVDDSVIPLFPAAYSPTSLLPFAVPGLGLIIAIAGLTLVGALTAGLVGRLIVRMVEQVMARTPVLRSVYGAIKQIMGTVIQQQSNSFREVVLVEYPRRDMWTIAFVTGVALPVVQGLDADEMVNLFVPTTPNPTSGFLLFVPRRDVRATGMTVEEGLKLVVSCGIVTPNGQPERK